MLVVTANRRASLPCGIIDSVRRGDMEMPVDPNGTRAGAEQERPSLYALVIYLPDPLGGFLDDLRLEMVPGCNPHAHVSVLPPRPLPVAPEAAIEEARAHCGRLCAFRYRAWAASRNSMSPMSSISAWRPAPDQLREMHAQPESGTLGFRGALRVSPACHSGAGDPAGPGRASAASGRAPVARIPRAAPFSGRTHRVRAEYAQGNQWIDLAEGPLRAAPVG